MYFLWLGPTPGQHNERKTITWIPSTFLEHRTCPLVKEKSCSLRDLLGYYGCWPCHKSTVLYLGVLASGLGEWKETRHSPTILSVLQDPPSEFFGQKNRLSFGAFLVNACYTVPESGVPLSQSWEYRQLRTHETHSLSVILQLLISPSISLLLFTF